MLKRSEATGDCFVMREISCNKKTNEKATKKKVNGKILSDHKTISER